jgi:hypothetical protein
VRTDAHARTRAHSSKTSARVLDYDAIARDLGRGDFSSSDEDDDSDSEVIARAQARIAALPGSLASGSTPHPLQSTDSMGSMGSADSMGSIDYDSTVAVGDAQAGAPARRTGSGGGGAS